MGLKLEAKNVIRIMKGSISKVFKRKVPVLIPVIKGELLKDRVALITGGTSGIGFAIAKAFLENGATVIITGRNKEKLQNAEKKLKEINNNIYAIEMDISHAENIEKNFEGILKKIGDLKIDILVNNAGVMSDNNIGNTRN